MGAVTDAVHELELYADTLDHRLTMLLSTLQLEKNRESIRRGEGLETLFAMVDDIAGRCVKDKARLLEVSGGQDCGSGT